MKRIKNLAILLIAFTLLSGCEAKIENAKTETFNVCGNCGMCKKAIEEAVNINQVAKGKWNKNSKMILLTYDSIKTNSDAILKRVADAGYDNDKYRASDENYAKRPKCCHYKLKTK